MHIIIIIFSRNGFKICKFITQFLMSFDFLNNIGVIRFEKLQFASPYAGRVWFVRALNIMMFVGKFRVCLSEFVLEWIYLYVYLMSRFMHARVQLFVFRPKCFAWLFHSQLFTHKTKSCKSIVFHLQSINSVLIVRTIMKFSNFNFEFKKSFKLSRS